MPNQSSDQYDFLVSYARSDNATGWITRFDEELLTLRERLIEDDRSGAIYGIQRPGQITFPQLRCLRHSRRHGSSRYPTK